MLPRSYNIVKTMCQNAAKSHTTERLVVMQLGVIQRNLTILVRYCPRNVILTTDAGDTIASRRISCTRILSLGSKQPSQLSSPSTIKNGTQLSPKKSEVILDNIQEKSLEVETDKKKWIDLLTSSEKPKKDVRLDNVEEKSLELDPALKQDVLLTAKVDDKQKLKGKILEAVAEKRLQFDNVAEKSGKPLRKRIPIDFSASSVVRNFITPNRAMIDFALKQTDLESLPKTLRRSPYECEPPIAVYWRRDVEKKALEVWGSKENLQKELIRRDLERRTHQQNLFTIKRRLKDYRKELGKEVEANVKSEGLFGRSGKVVMTAVAINATNFCVKLFAWVYTGSHSMFSECIHSLADTVNQLILAYGIQKSVQDPDIVHPYGYTNMKYVASLISGVGIFCVGAGLSFYHGVIGLLEPHDVSDYFWAYIILSGSVVSEGLTLYIAFNSIKKGAKEVNMPVREYIMSGQDPSVNVVLLEDMAAVTGVTLAAGCMGLSSLTGSYVPDAIGSLLVGTILGGVASFIIYTNVAALVGRSIPQEQLHKINEYLESDIMIRAIHDVKGIDMGNSLVRYKAEIDFDGRELTHSYLDKQDLNEMLEEIKNFQNIDQLEGFLLKHGENIVDMMGAEIDRIELKLKKQYPIIRHCDLEIL